MSRRDRSTPADKPTVSALRSFVEAKYNPRLAGLIQDAMDKDNRLQAIDRYLERRWPGVAPRSFYSKLFIHLDPAGEFGYLLRHRDTLPDDLRVEYEPAMTRRQLQATVDRWWRDNVLPFRAAVRAAGRPRGRIRSLSRPARAAFFFCRRNFQDADEIELSFKDIADDWLDRTSEWASGGVPQPTGEDADAYTEWQRLSKEREELDEQQIQKQVISWFRRGRPTRAPRGGARKETGA